MFDFFDFIKDFLHNKIPAFIASIIGALYEWIEVFALKCFNIILEVLTPFIKMIDASDIAFIATIQSWWGEIPYDVLQMLTLMNVHIGLGILVGALAIRIVKNRIPFIGR